MQEELARLRVMKDEIELQHTSHQKRMELKIQEEINQKKVIEDELNRTRRRLVEELDSIKNTKAVLSAQIVSLKKESEKKTYSRGRTQKSSRNEGKIRQ